MRRDTCPCLNPRRSSSCDVFGGGGGGKRGDARVRKEDRGGREKRDLSLSLLTKQGLRGPNQVCDGTTREGGPQTGLEIEKAIEIENNYTKASKVHSFQ